MSTIEIAEKYVKLQNDIIDLCDTLDIEEELTNDLYQIVTKHYNEIVDWIRWEKQFDAEIASSLRSEADGQRDK